MPQYPSDPCAGDNSSIPSKTVFESIQSRHSAAVYRLLQEASQPSLQPEIRHYRSLQVEWLRPQRWAQIYAEPEELFGRSSSSSEEADVWYLTWDCFRRYADIGFVFSRPVFMKQAFQDSGMYSLDGYMEMLWQRFPEQSSDVQNSLTGACTSTKIQDYYAEVCRLDLSSSDATASVSNAINLGRLARADELLLTRIPRFRLLSTLVDRATGSIGKNLLRNPTDIESSLSFGLLGFSVHFLGHTWIFSSARGLVF